MLHYKIAIFIFLVLTGCSLFCAGQLDVSLKNNATLNADIVKNDDVPATTVVPPKPTPATPSPAPTKPSSTSTTTTTTTTTTTVAPPTTMAPNTTTSQPITTTPAPAPYPDPSIGTWNSSCIMVKMAAQLNFTYETKDNKTATALYNVPVDAVVDDVHCDVQTTEFMQINWGPKDGQHSMLLQFDKVNNTVQLAMIRFILPLMSDRFPNAKDNQTIQLLHRGNDFSAPLKMSYHCTHAQTFNLTETIADKNIIGTVMIRDVQVEAFRNANHTAGFSSAHDCDSSETSDVVPIAVGIALAALIAIVLIAYLCARRRSTSRGYMSF